LVFVVYRILQLSVHKYFIGSSNSYKPITNTAWVRAQLCKLQKGCTKTGHHDIAEILLKMAFNTKNQSINQS